MCESQGGHPGLPIPNKPGGFCCCNARLKTSLKSAAYLSPKTAAEGAADALKATEARHGHSSVHGVLYQLQHRPSKICETGLIAIRSDCTSAMSKICETGLITIKADCTSAVSRHVKDM